MVSRPYKCSLCHSAFRNESGMKWHVAHRHEMPNALDALGKQYETKTLNQQEENAFLRRDNERLTRELDQAKLDLLKEKGDRLIQVNENLRLHEEIRKGAMMILARDMVLKQRLNIELPNPFEKEGKSG